MSVDGIVADACEAANVHDFASESFREGLELVVEEIERSATLTERARETLRRTAVHCLANRLRVDDYLERHPELVERSVTRPLIVTGLTRTGTTMLIDLLAKDPARRPLLKWEALDSVPPPRPDSLQTEPRMLDLRERQNRALAAGKGNAHIHWEEADGPTECIYLMAQDFKAVYWNTALAHADRYRTWLENVDMRPAFAHHRRVLQVLQHHYSGEWTLKSPEHAMHIDALMATYPDAKIVLTHRDPVETIGSSCGLINSFRERFHAGTPAELTDDLLEILAEYAYRPIRYRESHDCAWFDIHYRDLTSDAIRVIGGLYEFYGDELTPEAERRMRDHAAANPQGRHGRHTYGLADFGLTERRVRDAFAEYSAYYGIE
jgi:Sulfotransferase family